MNCKIRDLLGSAVVGICCCWSLLQQPDRIPKNSATFVAEISKVLKRSVLICFLTILMVPLSGQDTSLMQSMSRDSALHLTVIAPWKQLIRKKKDKVYRTCEVRVLFAPGDTLALPGRVKTRGNLRLEMCSMPPLKLKFEKGELAKKMLSPMNEMDIVHPCRDADQFDQFLLREYLAYKLYEQISPYHFKTQLIQLHYVNPDGTPHRSPVPAFLVENTEELVHRLAGRRHKVQVVSRAAVERESLLRVALFQFMIGNTDWFILNRHNLEFVGLPGHSLLVTVPYDFDYSGLVLPPYAFPHESLQLPSSSIRYYQGWCHPEDEVQAALQVFHDKKEEILSLPSRIPGFSDRSVRFTTEYLRGFFDVIENPQKLKTQIVNHCDMWPVRQ